jgi:hypothetical protein
MKMQPEKFLVAAHFAALGEVNLHSFPIRELGDDGKDLLIRHFQRKLASGIPGIEGEILGFLLGEPPPKVF